MTDKPGARLEATPGPLAAIAIVVAVSALAFAIEVAVADHLPWGAEARGVGAVLFGAIAALWLTVRGGGSLADLGLTRPKRWWTVPFWVVGVFITFGTAQALVPQLLAPYFDLPPPDMSRYEFIRGNPTAAVSFALLLPLTAAIPEEIVYRGFLIPQFERLYGDGTAMTTLAVLTQAIIFGSIHFQWGLGGVVMTTIMGLIWGVAFVLCGRNLWVVILAHSAAHVALVAQLYSAPAPV